MKYSVMNGDIIRSDISLQIRINGIYYANIYKRKVIYGNSIIIVLCLIFKIELKIIGVHSSDESRN